MNALDRRTFLKTVSIAASAGLTARLTSSSAWAQPTGSNGDLRIAVIGFNAKGANHINDLLKLPGVRIVALCDVDPKVLAREVDKLKALQISVFATTDARRVFERGDVDAVAIATSNHWHALLTVWACQAGKDVYVEKPVSHTLWEGRKMIEAAAKYGRVVQTGTQFRSDIGWPEAIAWLEAGHLGKIRAVHTICYKLRESIGRRLPWYPDWLDYDMYCGPKPMVPLMRDRLPYDWHWDWNTGNGELGNNGVHVLDLARRVSGQETLPTRVTSLGGRFGVDDVSSTPNTQLAVFEFAGGIPILFESRGLPAKPGVKYMDNFRGMRGPNGVAVLCEGGYLSGYTGAVAYDPEGKQIHRFTGDGGKGHMTNFLNAVRARRPQDLAAPIAVGHASTSFCHFGNIAYRIGETTKFAAARTAVEAIPEAAAALQDMQRNLSVHGIDPEKTPVTVGPWLQIDAANETIAAVEGGNETALERAKFLLKETQRAPWMIPDVV